MILSRVFIPLFIGLPHLREAMKNPSSLIREQRMVDARGNVQSSEEEEMKSLWRENEELRREVRVWQEESASLQRENAELREQEKHLASFVKTPTQAPSVVVTASGETELLENAGAHARKRQRAKQPFKSEEANENFEQCMEGGIEAGQKRVQELGLRDMDSTYVELKKLTDQYCNVMLQTGKADAVSEGADATEAQEVETRLRSACTKAQEALEVHIQQQPKAVISIEKSEAAIEVYCRTMAGEMDEVSKALNRGEEPAPSPASNGFTTATTSPKPKPSPSPNSWPSPTPWPSGFKGGDEDDKGEGSDGSTTASSTIETTTSMRGAEPGPSSVSVKDCHERSKNMGKQRVEELGLTDMDSIYAELQRLTAQYCEGKVTAGKEQVAKENGGSEKAEAVEKMARQSCENAQGALTTHVKGQTAGTMSISKAEEAVDIFCNALAEEVEQVAKALQKEEENLDESSSAVTVEKTEQKSFMSAWAPAWVPSCFPGDAQALVLSKTGAVPTALRDVVPGDLVAVGDASTGTTWFAPLLTDMHSASEHERQSLPYLKIVHEAGILHISSDHFVFTRDDGYVPAKEVEIGSTLLASKDGLLGPSRVLEIAPVYKTGMFAPLTWSGTVIVDGVLASNYVVTPADYIEPAVLSRFTAAIGGWNNIHHLSHFFMLPMRLAHLRILGFALVPIEWIRNWFLPQSANTAFNKVDWAVPRYVDVAVRTIGGVISVLF